VIPADSRYPVRFRDLFEIEDYLLLGAVLVLPWAFGGVEIWAYRMASLFLVGAAAVSLIRHGWDGLGLDRRARWLLPALLLGLWAMLQIVPLPGGAVGILSPTAHTLYESTFPAYPGRPDEPLHEAIEAEALRRVPETEGLPGPARPEQPFEPQVGGRWAGWRPLSLLPGAGLERLHWYFALLLGFLVARRRCADPDIAEGYRKAMFATFFALAVFGLLYAATSNGRLYWIRSTLENARPFGPYVNPTNFAGVMELAAPWLAGYTLLAWRRRSPSHPLIESRVPLLAAATLLCLLAAVATASKAAVALLAAALLTLALLAVRGRGRRLLVFAGALLAVVATVVSVSYLPLGDRMRDFLDTTGGEVNQVDRVVAWGASLEMAGDFAVTGSGFGSFRDVFPAYLPAGEYKRWNRVHNDYLEVTLEGGAIAAVLLAWLIWSYWRRVTSGLLRRTDSHRDFARIGLVLGLLALSVHALFDFNHQIPANALLFTTMAAIAVARAEESR
jgi:O-antigen ligase